jgi:hypothetical protein
MQIIAAVVLSVGLSTSVAAAQSGSFECGDLSITNGNGTDSTNTITCENETDIVIRCSNDIRIDVDNDQDADSGNATANGNTTVGDITTGDAENKSFVEANIEAACAAAKTAQTPPAPVVPTGTQPTAPAGGQGGSAATPKKVAVAALPNTGPATLVNGIALSAAGVGTLASLLHVGLSSYRRRAFRA